MSLTPTRSTPPGTGRSSPASPGRSAGPTGARAWARDLAMGLRFAVGGGREGWIRTLLTAVGVGLGVALLLGAASVPELMHHRDARSTARTPLGEMSGEKVERSDSTVLIVNAGTDFRDSEISGRVVRADGGHPVLPPGLDALPRPGELVVSPALRELMDSSDGKLLKERFSQYRLTGTIGDAGLMRPNELFYYLGSDTLTKSDGAFRTGAFGYKVSEDPLDPLLVVLVVLICVVLLTPVLIFIGTAVRFGGERRDQRLAALRLVGADRRAVRRIAAGEALCGALLGLLAGAGFFLAARQLLGVVDLWQINAFPSDMVPLPGLAALILLAVPVSSVLVTLVSLRAVAIEPLGVVRSSSPRGRRLWWRLLLPVTGLLILLGQNRLTSSATSDDVHVYTIAVGATLALVGLATLLPWLVEAAVRRLRGGPVPWQLATRRLQMNSGTAARAVSGITVAVAGAVALQMLFASMHDDFNTTTDQDPHRAQLSVYAQKGSGPLAQRMIDDFRATKGVKGVIGTVSAYVVKPGKLGKGEELRPTTELSVGTCTTLRELAHVGRCADGDTFVVHAGDAEQDAWVDRTARPGKRIDLNYDSWGDSTTKGHGAHVPWTLPKSTRVVQARPDPVGDKYNGILATPGAVDVERMADAQTRAMVQIDPGVADAEEYVRNTAARMDPLVRVNTIRMIERDKQYASVQRGLQAGAMATMTLIAASMLVSMLEQLRERKRLLAALTAFGTRRTSMAWSVLWQTAIPVALGLALAVVGGLALGTVMCRMVNKSVTDWLVFLPLTAAGAALVAVVTLLSLPPLWRMMRPDGLRTE
ncbi:FtsX-like permease family protein [Streptomyces sp. CC224B]|uniref:FtsX-like permease family protein n=1 Tax=Streptomyces sp. CC224B TaxID=3044571 RepID=UPI0024A806EB|nr:FtsX-like permease family protein [Streptomyces sp. CC224B]